jgi:hypothetical protein
MFTTKNIDCNFCCEICEKIFDAKNDVDDLSLKVFIVVVAHRWELNNYEKIITFRQEFLP